MNPNSSQIIIPLHPVELPNCHGCQEYYARWQGSIALHGQTTERLVAAHVALEDKESELLQAHADLARLSALLKAKGGKVPSTIQSRIAHRKIKNYRGGGR